MNIQKYLLLGYICLLSLALSAQHYISAGAGINISFYQSADMDLFEQSYNRINGAGLTEPLKGINNGAAGFRLLGSYHYLGKFYAGIGAGWQRSVIRDGAGYGNGEEREFVFTFSSLFSDIEFGATLDAYHIGGVAELAFQRKIRIESSHNSRDTVLVKSLDGDYISNGLRSLHLGLSAGVLRPPLLINVKILLPVYTSGEDKSLTDASAAKQAANTAEFPADFDEYANQPTYTPMRSNISSIRLVLSMSLALPVFAR